MKKLNPTKDIVLQYFYDYGKEQACKLLKLSDKEFNEITNPPIKD